MVSKNTITEKRKKKTLGYSLYCPDSLIPPGLGQPWSSVKCINNKVFTLKSTFPFIHRVSEKSGTNESKTVHILFYVFYTFTFFLSRCKFLQILLIFRIPSRLSEGLVRQKLQINGEDRIDT